MNDIAGYGRPQQDNDNLRHTLTIQQVSDQLSAAGVPRSERQIKRYCQSAFLDAKKIPGPTGDQWFIAPIALPKLIGDLQQWQMQRMGHSAARPAMSPSETRENSININSDIAGYGRPEQATSSNDSAMKSTYEDTDTAGHGRLRPAMTAQPETLSPFTSQLEKRIEEKDDFIDLLKGQLVAKDQQISNLSIRFGNLSDRFADTQKLLGAMQRMLAPLLGQGDPYGEAPKQTDREPQQPEYGSTSVEATLS